MMKYIFRLLLCLIITSTAYANEPQYTAVDLARALRSENKDLADQIKSEGISLDTPLKEAENLTLMHLAAGMNDLGRLQFLIENGADMYVLDNNNAPPFHIALMEGNYDITDYLLTEKNYDINFLSGPGNTTELTYAIVGENTQAIQYLLKHGADTDPAIELLMHATSSKFYPMIDTFAKSEIGLNTPSKRYNGSTALHLANENKDIPTVKYLIDRGADIYCRNASMMTVFDVSISLGNFDMATIYLEEYKYDMTTLDTWNRTSLFYATVKEDVAAVGYLFSKGADPNSYQYDASHYLNAYFYSAKREEKSINHKIVELYIENGLNLDAVDKAGYTYFHNSAMVNDPELFHMVNPKPEQLNTKENILGATPLHFAVMSLNIDTTKVLLEYGADPNITNNEGKASLNLANDLGNQDLINLLINYGAVKSLSDLEEGS